MNQVTLIAAVAQNGCIGVDNDMPWHIPEDFAFFKQYTLNKPVVMGRKTWESLPKKPLPQRDNIVVTRKYNYEANGAAVVNSLQAAFVHCTQADEVIVMGGADIYQQALVYATDLRITEVNLSVEGDAYFPEIDRTIWQAVSREVHQSIKGVEYAFVHYTRK